MLPDGSGEVKISGDTSDTAPAVSPQGDRIAIMSTGRESSGNWEIWTIDRNGGNATRLTNNPAADGLPTWSPDGRSIAFVSNREGVWAIWAMNSDGSNQRKLFNMQGAPDGQVLHDVPNSKGWLEERISWAP
jgi:TolB protein